MTNTQAALLTIDAVAQRLSCSRVHVYRLISDGRLKAVSISTPGSQRQRRRVTEEDLTAFISKAAL